MSAMLRYLAGIAGLLAILPAMLAPASAADAAAGKTKAAKCTVCHGLDGIAKNPNAPNLAGESTTYIRKQLGAFRSGERKDPQMSIMAKNLSDEDIADLAAWYSSLKVTVEMPK
jgi:cytochrome c553